MKKYTIKNYPDYIRDNPKGYWFKRKLYGWGWVPVRWQGWIIVLAFIGILLLNGTYFASKISPNGKPTIFDFVLFFGIIIISVIILFKVCYKKGEKPKWSWGR
ncbi:MAG: hypothetical protein Q8P81_03870 [Nanoarchaeota archaeon]|nr:hypothetical protein [Nanoarchaeota archaeon]